MHDEWLQVCQYLEMKDVLIKSTPALRITCRCSVKSLRVNIIKYFHGKSSKKQPHQIFFRNRKFFNDMARPLARKANPYAHPLVMDTFLRLCNVKQNSKSSILNLRLHIFFWGGGIWKIKMIKWFGCLLRAKWFELMNTEEVKEEEEEGNKRKREDKTEDAVKVKKIKLKVTRW